MKNKINIIAEVAQGFEGNYEQSKLLIRAAYKSGADAVKFQLVYADELATEDYQYYSLFKDLEMGKDIWRNLRDYSLASGLEFMVDIFGEKSLKTAEYTGIETIKIHGTDVTNNKLLDSIAKSSIKNVILGVGGAYLGEIKNAINILKNKSLTLLCGFQGYPTKIEENQIHRINVIKEKFIELHPNFKMGFADHAPENELSHITSIVAVGAGARCIEKHLTLGRIMELEDFESALNPDEFSSFVKKIGIAFKALGEINTDNDFHMSISEKKYRKNIRRDVVASRDIIPGDVLNIDDLILKRTSNPESIKEINLILGKIVKIEIKKNEPILKSNLIL